MGCSPDWNDRKSPPPKVYLWEILVPCAMLNVNDQLRPIKTRYHRVWDKKVRDITNGLTIMPPVRGHWVSPMGELFVEKMIPVRIMATKEQIHEISDMTAKYYRQEAVMFYRISEEVQIKQYGKLPNPNKPKSKGQKFVRRKDCPHHYTSRSACFRCTNEDNGGIEFEPEGDNEEDF